MEGGLDLRYREGIARVLLAACLLLFSIGLGILVLATAALGPPGLLGAVAYITGFAFLILGLGLAVDGFSRMTGRQA